MTQCTGAHEGIFQYIANLVSRLSLHTNSIGDFKNFQLLVFGGAYRVTIQGPRVRARVLHAICSTPTKYVDSLVKR